MMEAIALLMCATTHSFALLSVTKIDTTFVLFSLTQLVYIFAAQISLFAVSADYCLLGSVNLTDGVGS